MRPIGVYWRPSDVFVQDLIEYIGDKRVLEVFAGNGYLASLLHKNNVNIKATSILSSMDAHEIKLSLKNLGNVAFGRSEDFLALRIAIALVFSRSLRSENASSDEIACSHCCDVQATLSWTGRYWSRTTEAVGT